MSHDGATQQTASAPVPQKSPSVAQELRIYRVRVPRFTNSYVGFSAAWVLLVMLPLGIDAGDGFPLLRGLPIEALGVLVLVIAGITLGLARQLYHHTQIRLNMPQKRMKRLRRLLKHPETARRFPHRCAERLLRTGRTPGELGALALFYFRRLSPGTVILVNGPHRFEAQIPQGSPVFFQPVCIEPYEDKVADILILAHDSLPETYFDGVLTNRSVPELARSLARERLNRRVGRWLATLLVLFVLAVMGMGVLLLAGKWGGVAGFACVLLLIGILYVFRGPPRIWLVPGGIVIRWWSWFRRSPKVLFVRSSSSVLLANLRSGHSWISQGQRLFHAANHRLITLAILVAWLSQANPPTDDDIAAWFGGPPESDSRTPR